LSWPKASATTIKHRQVQFKNSNSAASAASGELDFCGVDLQTGGTNLTAATAAALFALCRLVVTAFAFTRFFGWSVSGGLSHLRRSRYRNLGGL
jgi:hypothetical protein